MQATKTGQQQICSVTSGKDTPRRPQVNGKFFYVGDKKLYIRGVTYGAFRPDADGNEYYNLEVVERDFAQMVASGLNAVRIPHTMPPRSLIDIAQRHGLRVMVGLSAEQYVGFLIDKDKKGAPDIEELVRAKVRACSGHPAILCYAIGNEIPAPIVRWLGRRQVERYIKRLYRAIKAVDPDGLVTYVNYPTTEYLQLPFLDLVCFNVYLEEQDRLASYLARLQNIAGDRPLIMSEVGIDSLRNGEEKQAEVLDWQIRTTFAGGCAGAFVFAWTDEWYRAGADVDDWAFGLTDQNRHPKPALAAVRKAFAEVPFPNDRPWPRISVIVCTYNGANTIRDCFEGLAKLKYPNFEVIVVNDGSTDATANVTSEYDFRVINTENGGLSSARNTGLEAATGEIIAYIDDDAYPDPHWLTYLAATFLSTNHAGIGGPNIPPPGDGPIADCVANAPGGPVHVLLSDQEAEHIPGCNMAFRKDCLKAIGGFDPQFRTAGDDVDVCWRLQDRGWTLGFSPAALVYHHCRNSMRTYWKQQAGYGKAEALLERKWPAKYNGAGHVGWAGRVYRPVLTKVLTWRRARIYHGVWGCAPFQSLCEPAPTLLSSLILMPEWYLVIAVLAGLSVLGAFWKPMLFALPLLGFAIGALLVQAVLRAGHATFTNTPRSRLKRLGLQSLTALLHLAQPLARLWGRLFYGLTPWRRNGTCGFSLPWPRTTTIWSEKWQAEEERLRSLVTSLRANRSIVRLGGDYDRWDLEVGGGLFGSVRIRMAVEDHGAGTQLVRFRTWAIVSPMGLALIILFVLLSLLAAIDQAWLVATLLGIVAVGLAIQVFRDCAAATAACQQVLRAQEELKDDDVGIEKDFILRKKVREGIIFVDFDRRQNSDPYYSGPERRSGIERRKGFAAASSQPGRRL